MASNENYNSNLDPNKLSEGMRDVPSVSELNESNLTEEDIFKMKELRGARSANNTDQLTTDTTIDSTSNFESRTLGSSSDVGEQGVKTDNEDDIPYDDEDDIPSVTQPQDMQITEEDMFNMKDMSAQRTMLGSEMQSAVSVADSASNFEEHVQDIGLPPAEDDNGDIPYDEYDEIEEKNSSKFVQISPCNQFAFNRFRLDSPDLPKDVGE